MDVYDDYSEAVRQLVSIRGNPGNNQFLILLNGQRYGSDNDKSGAVSAHAGLRTCRPTTPGT